MRQDQNRGHCVADAEETKGTPPKHARLIGLPIVDGLWREHNARLGACSSPVFYG